MVLVVDNVTKKLKFKVIEDVILGMDFIQLWDIESRNKFKEWRVGQNILQNGEWHLFDCGDSEGVGIFAECAGICELMEEDKKRLGKLVERILKESGKEMGTTTLIEHEIRVKPGAKPVRQAARRMSPKVLEFAHREVYKMLKEGIIEDSVSDWCSRPVAYHCKKSHCKKSK